MLDQKTRSAILRLRDAHHGARSIAKALGVSRSAVRDVLRSGSEAPPLLERAERGEPYRAEILALSTSCKGNLVRVHEELTAAGAKLSYPALTAFCRRHAIGHAPKVPAGQYVFAPGVEMQHDTSPHHASIGGKRTPVQSASEVLAHSTMLFFQGYPRFTRFECKVFLTDAAGYFDGACERCVIDNTHVVVASGSGTAAVMSPEMIAFADRFGFRFVAHEIGDANRSAKVERRFHFIENNFLAGREFRDWQHFNAEARAWCDRVNDTHRRSLGGSSARELFAVERRAMRPLPMHVPEVYLLHHRIVDNEGFVNVQRARYSVPWKLRLEGHSLEVRETRDRVEIFLGPRLVAEHARPTSGERARVIDPAHRPPRGEVERARREPHVEERRLMERAPAWTGFLTLMKSRGPGSVREVRHLARMLDDYPRDALDAAIEEAARFGMTDLERLERMVLQRIARDFLPAPRELPEAPSFRSMHDEEHDE